MVNKVGYAELETILSSANRMVWRQVTACVCRQVRHLMTRVSEAEFEERAEQPGTVERAARKEGRVLYAA